MVKKVKVKSASRFLVQDPVHGELFNIDGDWEHTDWLKFASGRAPVVDGDVEIELEPTSEPDPRDPGPEMLESALVRLRIFGRAEDDGEATLVIGENGAQAVENAAGRAFSWAETWASRSDVVGLGPAEALERVAGWAEPTGLEVDIV